MLELVKEIPVTFDPNWTDKWLVWLTLGSVAVSGLLGWLAYRNGREAGKIAKGANEREDQRLASERERLIREDRGRLAVTMIRAINAIDTASSTSAEVYDAAGRSYGPNPLRASARQEEDSRVDEALALITLANQGVPSVDFRSWFFHMVRHLRAFSVSSNGADYETAQANLFAKIAHWNDDPTRIHEMLALDFRGALGRERDPNMDCEGNFAPGED